MAVKHSYERETSKKNKKDAETTSFKVRQMDEIKLHETFGK